MITYETIFTTKDYLEDICDTISYEIVSGISKRVERIYIWGLKNQRSNIPNTAITAVFG